MCVCMLQFIKNKICLNWWNITFLLNPIALRTAKILWNFGHSECNRVKDVCTELQGVCNKIKTKPFFSVKCWFQFGLVQIQDTNFSILYNIYLADDGSLNQTLAKSEQLRELRQENYNLSTLFLKLKAMKVWRQNHDTANYSKTVS